jgi:hypothetical protein
VLGERRACSREDGTAGWKALEEIVGGLVVSPRGWLRAFRWLRTTPQC